MSVSSTATKNSHSGNGSTTAFAYGFKIFADADLEVIIRSSTGTETTKTITTHYTVAGAGNDAGGTVTFTTGNTPASGETVVIRRKLTLTQGTDYVENDPFPADSHEDGLDRLTFIAQGIQEELDRSFKVSKTNSITTTEFTEGSSDRANKLLSFDASGDLSVAQELGIYRGDWAASTSYDVRDLVKDTSTNNIFIATTAHTSSGSQPLTTNTDSAKWSLIVDAASATSAQTAAAASAAAAASSATAAASSATAAASSATSASSSSSTASTKASEASTSAASAAASFDDFDDRYLGAKSSEPSADNDGDALVTGALFFDTTAGAMKVYSGSAWEAAFVGGSGFLAATNNLSDVSAAATARTNLGLGTIATQAANSVSISGGSVTGITDIVVADGGTGASSFTANGVLVGNGSSALQVTATGSSGQVLTSNGSGSAPTFQALAAGGGTVTATSSGSITAGKAVCINSNGTVSEIAQTSISHAVSASAFTQASQTAGPGYCDTTYDTTNDAFFVLTPDGNTAGTLYAVEVNSSLVISQHAAPVAGPLSLSDNIFYDAATDRAYMQYRNGSTQIGHRTANIVSGVIKISSEKVVFAANYPFGAVGKLDADETIHLGNYSNNSYLSFLQRTAGSDASADTFGTASSAATLNEGNMTSVLGNYYSQIVHFTASDKFLLGAFGYGSGSPNPYGLQFAIGTIGGSAGSRSFTSESTGTVPTDASFSSFPKGFMQGGRIRYYSSIDRAVVFEGRHLYTISVDSSGNASFSALQDINPNVAALSGKTADARLIPGTNDIVLLYNDGDNSSRITYRLATITTGATAASDTFSLGTKQEISSTLGAASTARTAIDYSPDVDAFLLVMNDEEELLAFRVARTSTNATSSNFLGIAKSTVGDGASIDVAVSGSVATVASGMTAGQTQFVQATGLLGTTNAGFGTVGTALSSTTVLMA